MPTYASDVVDVTNEKEDDLSNVSGFNFSQNAISAFYDYYNQYEKGNSFSLAQGINYDGSLKGVNLKDKKALWNIFGTNLSEKSLENKKITLKTKFTVNNDDSTDDISDSKIDLTSGEIVKLAITLDSGKVVIKPIKFEKDIHGWYSGSYDIEDSLLSNIGNQKVAKIGLYVSPTSNSDDYSNVVLDLGELSLENKQVDNVKTDEVNSLNIKSEYTVARKDTLNARISWDKQDNVKYYEIFVYDPNKKQSYMVGQTTQNIYFVSQVIRENGLYIGVKPVYENSDGMENIYVQEITK